MEGFDILTVAAVVAAAYTLSRLRIIKQYERGVSFFLGRYWNTKGPGLKFLPTGVAHMHRVSLRIVALDIPPQDVITRDNVSVKVNPVLYMKVRDPAAAIIGIEKYLYATSQLAQTTLRAVLGQHHLDELLAERERINETLKEIIDKRTDEWGIEVSAVCFIFVLWRAGLLGRLPPATSTLLFSQPRMRVSVHSSARIP